MRNPIAVIATIALAITTGIPLLAAPADELRIISPRNGTLVRPGQILAVTVTGEGEPRALLVIGGEFDVFGAIAGPLGNPPWIVVFGISLAVNPGKIDLGVMGDTGSGKEMFASVVIDVEPVEIPPVTFSKATITMGVDTCLKLRENGSFPCIDYLFVNGKYPDGTDVILNESTRINFVSQDPSIAAVSGNGGGLVGVSPGVTKLVVFGKYAIDVTVLGPRR
jgi:hypothetical protein